MPADDGTRPVPQVAAALPPTTARRSKSAPAGAERHELTSVQGLAALSLDALSSVAYGPEAVVLVVEQRSAPTVGDPARGQVLVRDG